ncbi:MAG: protein phosphatase 2C domain-containing protein [Bacillota bacterium]|nr:protein phosphatase 2C domain-containing protein [Bacillota bacterium]
MICRKCGAAANEGDNFCEECGASLKPSLLNRGTIVEDVSFPKSKTFIYNNNLAAVTNVGRKHPVNEDSCMVMKCDNGDIILAVADGVTSAVNSISASMTAVEAIREVLIKGSGTAREIVFSAIQTADDCIKKLPFETREDGLYGPETTVAVALIREGTATIGWIGDSRAYMLNREGQQKLTMDDSWIEMVVAEGKMTREEASANRMAHCVTQVLGMHDQEIQVHILEQKLRKGDILLLCSDGLWNYLQGENIFKNAVEAFGIDSEAIHICEHLVELANAAGGHDNITAAMFRN